MTADTRAVRASLPIEEWQQPCESQWHEQYGAGPAQWIIWQVQCCHKRPPFGLACDPCLQAILTYPGAAKCLDCGVRHDPARHALLRVEPLGGGQ